MRLNRLFTATVMLLVAVILGACQPIVMPTPVPQTEENKAIVRRHIEELVNKRNLDALDDVATDVVWHDAPPGLAPGREGMKQWLTIFGPAFPDWHSTIEIMIAEGDMVATRTTGRGTHTGEFIGIPPTGKQVTMTGMDIHRIVDGKIVEEWSNFDALGLLQQLGVVPPPGQAGE